LGVVWAASAFKHGFEPEDAITAILGAIVHVEDYEGTPGLRLWIGPRTDVRGEILEVIAEVVQPDGLVVFHVDRITEQRRRDHRVDQILDRLKEDI
jgi:hypothetical protein